VHGVPHDPQFAASDSVFTQAPLQSESPVLHLMVHAAFEHVPTPPVVPGHSVPQAPQLPASDLRSVQAVPHWVKPAAQANPQTPAAQAGVAFAGAVQALPQPLQLAGSAVMSTQAFPQAVWVPHTLAQAPDEHTSSAAHLVPQAPQFCAFDLGSTQTPPQFTSGALHTMPHLPAEHTAVALATAGHLVLHAPQLVTSLARSAQAAPQSE
jgi:hypothetical protein